MFEFTPLSWPEIVVKLREFIEGAVTDRGDAGAVLGVSGGIDSAVTAALAVHALGADRVHACFLPDTDSGEDMLRDAESVTEWLKIRNVHRADMTPIIKALGAYDMFGELYALPREQRQQAIAARKSALLGAPKGGTGTFLEGYRQINPEMNRIRSFWNQKIRARMVVLYGYAELHKLTVLGTTNKSEYLTGSFTKYGDGAVDVEVILPLYKRRVFELAEYLGVPEAIQRKTPTGDILPDVTDEDIIGVPYATLDHILLGIEKRVDEAAIAREAGVDVATVQHVAALITTSRHGRTGALAPELMLD